MLLSFFWQKKLSRIWGYPPLLFGQDLLFSFWLLPSLKWLKGKRKKTWPKNIVTMTNWLHLIRWRPGLDWNLELIWLSLQPMNQVRCYVCIIFINIYLYIMLVWKGSLLCEYNIYLYVFIYYACMKINYDSSMGWPFPLKRFYGDHTITFSLDFCSSTDLNLDLWL